MVEVMSAALLVKFIQVPCQEELIHKKSEIHLNCMQMRETLEQDTMLCG